MSSIAFCRLICLYHSHMCDAVTSMIMRFFQNPNAMHFKSQRNHNPLVPHFAPTAQDIWLVSVSLVTIHTVDLTILRCAVYRGTIFNLEAVSIVVVVCPVSIPDLLGDGSHLP